MSIDALIAEAKGLSVDDRMRLIGEVWDSVSADGLPTLTPAQIAELDRRIADMDEHPDDQVPWDQGYADVMDVKPDDHALETRP